MTEEQAQQLRMEWFRAFPEMDFFMRPQMCRTGPDGLNYQASTVTGRIRRNCSANSALNFAFQGLAADAVKAALWGLRREGFKIVNFIHDEVICELPEDRAGEQVRRMAEVMVNEAKSVIPDVEIRTESALMRRWSKDAKPVYGADGMLQAWDEDEE